MNLDQTSEYSLFGGSNQYTNHDKSKPSNYLVEIQSSLKKNTPGAFIWSFDSGSRGCVDIKSSYGCVEED